MVECSKLGGIEEAWQNLSLTDREDTVVGVEVEDDEITRNRVSLMVAGKILTNKPFSVVAMKNKLRLIWKPQFGLAVREIESNLFIFQFFSPLDKERVMEGCLWNIDDYLILLKEIEGSEQPSEVKFNHSPFWMKVHDKTFDKRNLKIATAIGNHVEKFLEYDDWDVLGLDKTMKIKVLVDVTKPLIRGMKLAVGRIWKWSTIKYVRLPIFCYTCGIIGHVERECPLLEDDTVESTANQFRAWLRVSPFRPGGRRNQKEAELEKSWLDRMRARQKQKYLSVLK